MDSTERSGVPHRKSRFSNHEPSKKPATTDSVSSPVPRSRRTREATYQAGNQVERIAIPAAISPVEFTLIDPKWYSSPAAYNAADEEPGQ